MTRSDAKPTVVLICPPLPLPPLLETPLLLLPPDDPLPASAFAPELPLTPLLPDEDPTLPEPAELLPLPLPPDELTPELVDAPLLPPPLPVPLPLELPLPLPFPLSPDDDEDVELPTGLPLLPELPVSLLLAPGTPVPLVPLQLQMPAAARPAKMAPWATRVRAMCIFISVSMGPRSSL